MSLDPSQGFTPIITDNIGAAADSGKVSVAYALLPIITVIGWVVLIVLQIYFPNNGRFLLLPMGRGQKSLPHVDTSAWGQKRTIGKVRFQLKPDIKIEAITKETPESGPLPHSGI